MNRIQRLSAAAASFAITAAILSSVAGYALPEKQDGQFLARKPVPVAPSLADSATAVVAANDAAAAH